MVDEPLVVGKGTTARHSALRAALDAAVFSVWVVGALCITKDDPDVGSILDAMTGIARKHPAGLSAAVSWLGNVFDGKVQLGHVLVQRVEHRVVQRGDVRRRGDVGRRRWNERRRARRP